MARTARSSLFDKLNTSRAGGYSNKCLMRINSWIDSELVVDRPSDNVVISFVIAAVNMAGAMGSLIATLLCGLSMLVKGSAVPGEFVARWVGALMIDRAIQRPITSKTHANTPEIRAVFICIGFSIPSS